MYNKSIHGKLIEGDKIGFEGNNTKGNIIWKTSGDSYREIYYNLVNMEVITTVDSDPVEDYILEELGKTYSDYEDENGDINFDRILEDGSEILTEKAYKEIIQNEDGNAYYQKFYKWNETEKKFEEI